MNWNHFCKGFCNKLWRKSNPCNIRHLVDNSFVPANQQTSKPAYYILDWQILKSCPNFDMWQNSSGEFSKTKLVNSHGHFPQIPPFGWLFADIFWVNSRGHFLVNFCGHFFNNNDKGHPIIKQVFSNLTPSLMGKHFPTCAVPVFGSTLFCHMCSSSFDLWIVCTYSPTCAVPAKYALPYSPTCAVPARIWTSNSWLMYTQYVPITNVGIFPLLGVLYLCPDVHCWCS